MTSLAETITNLVFKLSPELPKCYVNQKDKLTASKYTNILTGTQNYAKKYVYTFFFIFMYVPCILCIVFFNSTNNTLYIYIYIYTFLTIIQTKKQRNTFHTRPVNLTQIKLSPEQINTLDIGFDYAKEKHSSSQLHKMYHSRRTAKIS